MQTSQNLLKTYTAISGNQTLISVKAQDVSECPPADVTVIVDRSGSIDASCTA